MANDTWATPQPVFDYFNRKYNFTLDVCAQDETAKCENYYTIEDDAFTKNWTLDAAGAFDGACWCNPPYSNITPWIERSIITAQKGIPVVMLVMCDQSVKWFSFALKHCTTVEYIINGRLAFLNNGIEQKGNNKGSVIFTFIPNALGLCQTKYIDRKDLFV